MDPKQTLIDLDQAISDLDASRVFELIGAYTTWRLGGGFEPRLGAETIRGESRGDRVFNVLIFACIGRFDADADNDQKGG